MYRVNVYVFVFALYSSFQISCQYDESQPLFLTPFIINGKIKEAQKLSVVEPFLPHIVSHSGYITTDEKHRSHMFFWFFPKSTDWTEAPLIIWLQGGPGASSLYAIFMENGPYVYKDRGQFGCRISTWTNDFNLLYIDNPVGTGFSFTESPDGYSTNEERIGENLHETLRQFLILFPQLQGNPIILSGESYAGKYLTTLANTISRKRERTLPNMNVFGIFVGNPLISFEHMLPHYNEFLYAYGLLDLEGRAILRRREEEILSLIYARNWSEATDLFANTFFENDARAPTLFYQLTGLHNHYHLQNDRLNMPHYGELLRRPSTQKILHVGNYSYHANTQLAKEAINLDIMKSFKKNFEEVLENYRVLVFSGQFDIICSYYLNEELFNQLSWSGAETYRKNKRYKLEWDESLVGYYKQANNFTHVLIRNAGHMSITDQPLYLLGLLKKFVFGAFDQYVQSLNISFNLTKNVTAYKLSLRDELEIKSCGTWIGNYNI